MSTMSIQENDNERQVDKDTLQLLNLKIDNNLDEYIILIIGIDYDHHLSENLSRIINEQSIKWFNDIETSLSFIHSVQNINIFIIISGKLGRDYAQKCLIDKKIVGLYVYCMNEDKHRIWTKGINKIRCTVSDATKLFIQIHRDIKELSGRWPINEKSFEKATTSTSEWYNLFLLLICYRSESIKESYMEMFNECRAYYQNNPSMIKQIDQFQQTYKSNNAIHEYTRDTFLYRIVNHALRTRNIKIIRKFSPFIRDLHSQLHNYHQKYYKFKKDYIRAVYRGQHLSVDQIEYLRLVSKSNNPFITMTTVSSASLDPDVALNFAYSVDGRISCLFEIIIPDRYNVGQEYLSDDEQVFANIASLSVMPDEQEVLFSLTTRYYVKHVGYPINQSNCTWVPIVLKLISITETGRHYNYFDMIKWIENEKDPQIYADILHMIQINVEDEIKFQSTNWQNWWNNLKRHSGQGLLDKQPLHLIFYDCFTEDIKWSRKAIQLHKDILHSTPSIQLNSSSFSELFRIFKIWQQRPTIQIAIYEDYLKQFCIIDTEEVIKCLCLAGDAYKRITDNKCALECYQKVLNMNVDDKYRMNNKIQKQINTLQKSPNTIRTTNNTERRLVKNNSNQEYLELYETQQDLWLLYPVIKSKVGDKISIEARLKQLFNYIQLRESWYDMVESKICLRLPYENTTDLSVNDYRYNFLSAVHTHISSKNSIMDATNNNSLSLWRYTKYMYEWMLCKELERFLQYFQKRSKYICCFILPQLERIIKKLHVIITICTIYITIKVGQHYVNVNNIQFLNKTNPEMRHPIYIDLRNSDLLTDLTLFEDKNLPTEETTNTIPDHMRLISRAFIEFMEGLS
ncbi:unnamed protein product [Didymodactylos carnosus]|uniref:Uncharacterized protein n=1 Tax=Didymodactylos carnosus TaxID=1234261 RepID=A0A814VL52_9BILA|nr:unnamed protein product [Didymodactylos carnosus]CAF1189887.1 unnamed protein product [Didymodactylos carnosus]CAF3876138.1 unnamed protein product [Didymodactylos carnosus]CAF3954152.1 unnamed protein product [Didymodactylos carnosus]